jgi:type VI secretion system protein ImpA
MTHPGRDLLAPIPGDNPAGLYLRYEPLYEQIKEARREDDDLPQGDWQTARKTADWTLVIKLATDALAKRTKDLQIAAWLTEAWLRREGFAGLRDGLRLLHDMLQQYWDSVYPDIEDDDTDMRAAPLAWVGLKFELPVQLVPLNLDGHSLLDHRVSRTVPTRDEAESSSSRAETREALIAEGRIAPEDIERGFANTPKAWYRDLVADLDASLQLLHQLAEFCNERFIDPPSFSALENTLKDVRQFAGQLLARKLELEPDGEPSTAAPPAERPATGLSAELSAVVAVAEHPIASPLSAVQMSAPRNAEEAAAWVGAAARMLREASPTAPASYLLLRGLRWGELRSLDGSIDPRLLVAPPSEVRTRMRALLLDNAWPQLLHATEDAMARPYGRAWLDLQRYTLTALAGLGAEYEAVDRAIRSALRTLLADLPALATQTLMDDSPTANAETLQWLRDEQLFTAAQDATAGVAMPSAMRRDVHAVAQAHVRAGEPHTAVQLLMHEAAQEKSARARFMRRVQAADIMLDAGMQSIAFPILRELLTLIETHRLEEWEAGDTVAQPLALLYRCARQLDSGDVNVGSLYEQICRLDPIRAIQLRTAHGGDEGS